ANLKLVKSGARHEQIEALEAQEASLKALLENYKVDVQRTTLVSPIAGRIVTPHVEELSGIYLKPGQRDLVAQIEDSRTIRAEVEVPEEDVSDLRIGSPVKVATWAYHNVTFHGRVVSIAPIAATNDSDSSNATVYGQGQGTAQVAMSNSTYKVVRVVTEIPNPDGRLKSEMTGYAKIATGYRPVWDVLFRPLIRWFMVEVWYWIP
ncbi:MAG TPA: efflux RND transporter periplasmic adaptor subunit, partial [Candidatus Polarisedimenticolia bacterium]|nr:efflux RND transporter periplasmic adaptor subunit [Candidatus Polarisedimenticolia bacterium]